MNNGKLIMSTGAFCDFKKDYMADKLSQAYLFVCEDKLTADEFIKVAAATLVCENKNLCGLCVDCKKSAVGTHPDIMVYPKGKNFVVDDASNIYDNIQIKPIFASKKVKMQSKTTER